jgi:phosphopantothenoylcysteine decarboxylase/phosphopantothenate--cysteine ligase
MELGRARRGSGRPVLVGFAAESGDPVARGREKLTRKMADLIVANDISRSDAGFDSEMNAASLVTADGVEPFPLGPKTALASLILDRAEAMLARVRD